MRLSSRCLCPVLATALLLPALSHATVFYYPNNTGITIQDDANASPFPSLVSAAILPAGNAQVARVHIFGFTHTYPDDVDVYLMAPNGTWIILFSDAGGNTPVTGRNFAFSDIAAAALPDGDALTNGTYRPDPGTEPLGDVFPAEANRVTTLRELTTGGHAGSWGLYVRDDFGGDAGSITGWGIEFDTPPGRMTKSRQFHSATLLSSGKVLVAGGADATSTVLASTDLYDPVLGGWTAGAPMGTARVWGTATSLGNGHVLVAGGANGGALAQTEIYDSSANTWTPAANLNTARYRHSAVLLFDGRVLVCGGNAWTNGTSLPGCEIYTRNTGQWTPTGNLGTGRYNHTATVLPDGRVLVTGGYTTNAGNQPVATCEIYNPGTGLWTPTGSLPEARQSHTATLLHNGVVLVAGGNSNSGTLDTAAIFDPTSGSWTATGSLTHRRYDHTATLLPDNTVMVNGGSGSTTAMAFVEIYTPDTGLWTVPSGIAVGSRTAHTATLLQTGDVLLAGGGENDGLPRATADMVPFRPAVAWSSFNNVTLNTARQHHTATLLPDGKVLVAGGYTSADLSTLTNTAEIVDPVAGTITPTANAMAISRASHTATLLPKGDVLVVGGGTTAVDRYHPATRTWSAAAPYPDSITWHTATLLHDGRVLVAGGSGAERKCRIYDPNADTWTVTGDLIGIYRDHTATLLPDGRALVVGGVYNSNQAELFDPAANGGAGAWTATGSTTYQRFRHTATLLPSGKVLVVGGSNQTPDRQTAEVYDPQPGTWSTVAPPLYQRDSHRAVLLPDGRVWIQGGIDQIGRDKAEIYDPVRDTWTEVPVSVSGEGGLPYSTLTLLLDGNLLQTGGEFSTGFATVTSSYVSLLNRRFAPPERAPQVTPFHFLDSQRRLGLRGQRLIGLSEGSGGNGAQSSPGIPLLQFRRLDNEQITYLPLNPSGGIASISLTTAALNLTPGAYAITVFANAIPSDSRVRLYHGEPSIKLVRGPSNTWSALASNLEADTAYSIETTPDLGIPRSQGHRRPGTPGGPPADRPCWPTATCCWKACPAWPKPSSVKTLAPR
jgi:subtilisin-like proprotein convertase family protein/N-acetylneuraminic acid mutarotase